MSRAGMTGHGALMDSIYRRQRHIYDFTRKYYLMGRDRLVRELHARPGQCVIEIGCGTARNLIRIARMYPGVRLYGLDASREMLLTAEKTIERYGLAGRIRLAHSFAEELTPALFGLDGPADHAIFSYSLSMIPDWRGALIAAVNMVKQDGFIHVVDFGDLKGLGAPAGHILRAWLKLFHVTPRAELLASFEKVPREGLRLRILKGRYAFVLSAHPEVIEQIVNSPVAG